MLKTPGFKEKLEQGSGNMIRFLCQIRFNADLFKFRLQKLGNQIKVAVKNVLLNLKNS